MSSTKQPKPSPFFTRLFRWFCNSEYFEELQGDLEENFFENLETLGKKVWQIRLDTNGNETILLCLP